MILDILIHLSFFISILNFGSISLRIFAMLDILIYLCLLIGILNFCIIIFMILGDIKHILSTLIYRININSQDLYRKNLSDITFFPFSKFPENKNLLLNTTSLKYSKLPRVDLNKYILDGVDLYSVKFNKHTVLPDDLNFMQRIKDKSLLKCIMPEGDYSKYNFDGMLIKGTKFPKGCVFPNNYDFFTKLNPKSLILSKNIPKSVIKNIHLYKLNKNISIRESLLSDKQKVYLKIKYKEKYKDFVYKGSEKIISIIKERIWDIIIISIYFIINIFSLVYIIKKGSILWSQFIEEFIFIKNYPDKAYPLFGITFVMCLLIEEVMFHERTFR